MAAIVTKAIKPKRIKLDVFRLETLTGMNEISKGINKDFQKTVKTWKKKPKFVTIKSLRGGNLELFNGTDNQVFQWVSDGTKGPYLIPKQPKPPGTSLVFPSHFTPKTIPNITWSGAGSTAGPMVYAKQVTHPGIKARNFDKVIAKRWDKRFKRRMEKAMRIAAQKSGHAI
jgi:hypothetical protein